MSWSEHALKKLVGISVALAAMLAVGISQDCTLGSPLSPTSASGEEGHFLDLGQPATCAGTVTGFNYCYYTDSVLSRQRIHVRLWVWRPIGKKRYRREFEGQFEFVTDTPLPLNTTVCKDRQLRPTQYFQTHEGDILAAYVKQSITDPVRLVAALPLSSGRGLYRDPRDINSILSSQFVSRDDLELVPDIGMHLFAVLADTTPPTPGVFTSLTAGPATQDPKTPFDDTDNNIKVKLLAASNNDTELGSGPSGDSMKGTAVGVAVTFLSLIIAAAFLIGFLLLYYRKKKANSFKFLRGRSIKNMFALDNAIYRIGSRHVAPSKSSSQRKRSDHYDYPITDKESLPEVSMNQNLDEALTAGSNTYDILKANALSSNTYSIPSSIPATGTAYDNQPFQTEVMVEPQQLEHVYQIPRESGTEPELEVAISLDPKLESAEYIYMPENEIAFKEAESNVSFGIDEEEYIGPEEYQAKLAYDSVQYRSLLEQATADAHEDESPYRAPPSREDEIYIFISQQKIKVIPRNSITVTEVIGSGHFGDVDRGLWKSIKKNATLDVALKSLPKNGSTEDKIKLMQEALIMGQFSHPNVIQLYGIMSQGGPLVLVLEYMANKDMKKYLHQLKLQQGKLSDASIPNLLLSFSEQVALGMHYLASKRLVHRDLAARNILISQENICKIGDFGMARDISDNGFYLGNDGKVPLKWTAPEAISLKKYSIASDVWSYGCLLYEIWSFGTKPYKGLKNDEAIAKVTCGYRLPPPPGCPLAIYALMMQCWHPVSTSRPKYQAILTSLLEDPKKVLHIPQCDASSHSLACILGSALEAGFKMYPSLQVTYVPDDSCMSDPDYEYMKNDSDCDSQ